MMSHTYFNSIGMFFVRLFNISYKSDKRIFFPMHLTCCIFSCPQILRPFASETAHEPHLMSTFQKSAFSLETMLLLTGLGTTHLHMACFPEHSLLFPYNPFFKLSFSPCIGNVLHKDEKMISKAMFIRQPVSQKKKFNLE